jgi:hypothetical protein
MDTSNPDYSPWQLLPAPEPRTVSPPDGQFYHSVAKHLIKDTVRITNNGLGIDLDKVEELETVIDDSINSVLDSLNSNPIVKRFIHTKHAKLVQKKTEEREARLKARIKTPDHFIPTFKHTNMVHRSYFMHVYCESKGISQPSDTVHSGIAKWPANTVKKLAKTSPFLTKLINGELTESNKFVSEAMRLLAEHKCEIHNSKLVTSSEPPEVEVPSINPRSPDDKHAIFTGILGYESGKLTESYEKYERDLNNAIKYGNPEPDPPKNQWSWGRKQFELLLPTLTDPDEISLFKAFIEFSFGDKIKSSFIPAFYKYTINGRLYSNLKLLGAKTGRFTSSNPNMLQLPSTGSIYAKAVKKCFIAEPGNVILTADFNALEDRILASITLDAGKCALLEDPSLDGHCYNALGYYGTEVSQYLDTSLDYNNQVRQFAKLVEDGHKELKELRQRSKAVTFKLAYGGMPDAHKGGVITEDIYFNYHNKLYSGVRNYIDSYVLPTSSENGKLHLGLGFYIHSDNVSKDQRTLHNSSIQFWSILSILAINQLHNLIDKASMQDHVKVISSIYDSVYIECTADPEIIKWTNDNLINCMTKDFMPNQRIPNTAESEIGLNWADLHAIPNSASLAEIQQVLDSL